MNRSERYRSKSLSLMFAWVLARSLLAGALGGLLVGFLAFDWFEVPSLDEMRRASAAVVFTGGFHRIDAGLQLLDAGAVPRLYVSGPNATINIFPDIFFSVFAARNPNIKDMKRLSECCIESDERAESTIQNALDTKCWVNRRGLAGPLLLITSRAHMARAVALLANTLPHHVVVPYPVDDPLPPLDRFRTSIIEYIKYLGALVIIRLPWIVDAKRFEGSFAENCSGAF